MKKLRDDSQCIHGPNHFDDPHGALTAPLYQTSTFHFKDAAQGAARFAGEEPGYIYTRLGNPTTRELEEKVARLEGMEDAAATATGMGAVSASVLSFLQQGDHMIASSALYGCSFALFAHMLPKFGIEVSFIDLTDEQALRDAVQENTKLLFAETPINPNMTVLDLKMLGEIAKQHELLFVVDNTFMTPLLQKPVNYGADLIVHSATKYLNGHGDVVAGLVCGSKEHIELIKLTVLKDIGATISPHDAWLINRGLKTLALRVQRHCQSAQTVAEFLEAHPKVNKVYYPGLPSHPGYQFLGEQMKGAGGVIAFEINGSLEQGEQFINATELCTLAVSLGDPETLIQHPASMTHSPYTQEERLAAGISDGLIRISVGLEDVEDIIDDLKQAFNKI
ncbi:MULTISPECIES: trans-sulfuration enzyme family protein [Pseudoalteromonas]|uniref:trans-sulfuration enzyme family protein n=1 Tax=Pseudoalteromonas TaxID=53246 RepID=UPI00057E5612|nr:MULTISPECIES: aminotransferase class V-fold PLP-dependent enzyme [Pseudoalteromonas]KID32967.1 methionine gamma-lyase [Pseudoalteromonas flavipulchra NCIMB 2033 = ATCC BAA-314]MBD0781128.1 aminotransferase class V-fold PLP-dependent enzyme [Pseudoalteromonas flavipulchra]MBE0373512.1 methionine-gamma-lyase [Pseudoalteromonas flavipulchra NCIMB 2033 = ATCC BAA-314]NKC19243.1 aminotransferase class V-fold PLP-dependent enzyme [Pseudoalteromonas galatheae]RXE87180.1 aminotransferase class V-fo